jgi:hypothetical protein
VGDHETGNARPRRERYAELGQVSMRLLLRGLTNQIILSITQFVEDASRRVILLVVEGAGLGLCIWLDRLIGPFIEGKKKVAVEHFDIVLVAYGSRALTVGWWCIILVLAWGTLKSAISLVNREPHS